MDVSKSTISWVCMWCKLYSAIIYNPEIGTSQLTVQDFCIFFSEEFKTTLIGNCPYGAGGPLPMNVSELRDDARLCDYWHRTGQLCGECDKNYTLPVYSYYLGCVKCEDYRYGWVKFIVAAFLPLTLR